MYRTQRPFMSQLSFLRSYQTQPGHNAGSSMAVTLFPLDTAEAGVMAVSGLAVEVVTSVTVGVSGFGRRFGFPYPHTAGTLIAAHVAEGVVVRARPADALDLSFHGVTFFRSRNRRGRCYRNAAFGGL